MNRVIISGRLTADLQVRYNASTQMAIGSFTLANDDGYGEKKKTNFVNCVIFGDKAESMEKYTAKGCRVLVEGRISTGSYEKNDGTKVKTTEIIADRVEYIDFKDKQNDEPKQTDFAGFQQIDEDCPF